MKKPTNAECLKLPDALLVRYFRAGESDAVERVTVEGATVGVKLKLPAGERTDHWRDLGGGLGFVPDSD